MTFIPRRPNEKNNNKALFRVKAVLLGIIYYMALTVCFLV